MTRKNIFELVDDNYNPQKETEKIIDFLCEEKYFYDGADADCLTEALGSSCEVMFFVTNTKA